MSLLPVRAHQGLVAAAIVSVPRRVAPRRTLTSCCRRPSATAFSRLPQRVSDLGAQGDREGIRPAVPRRVGRELRLREPEHRSDEPRAQHRYQSGRASRLHQVWRNQRAGAHTEPARGSVGVAFPQRVRVRWRRVGHNGRRNSGARALHHEGGAEWVLRRARRDGDDGHQAQLAGVRPEHRMDENREPRRAGSCAHFRHPPGSRAEAPVARSGSRSGLAP